MHNASDNSAPHEITHGHREASRESIAQVCDALSVREEAARQLFVDVGHLEDPGFLNPELQCFWILPVIPGESEDSVDERLLGVETFGTEWAADELREWTSEAGVAAILAPAFRGLLTPNAASESEATVLACVLNQAIEVQIEAVLSSLAMLVARQNLLQDSARHEVYDLGPLATQADDAAKRLVSEEIRSQGWRAAAGAIRERARSSGFSLHVRYRQPLFSAAQLRDRMPLARHVYNVMPGVSGAVDKIVNVLSQGWSIAGPVPEDMLRTGRDALEASGVAALTAHVIRDAFVCGAGVLALEGFPVQNPWLVRPEDVDEIQVDGAIAMTPDGLQIVSPVLSMVGAAQFGSTLGLSILEPLIQVTANYELYLRVLLQNRAMQQIPEALAEVGDLDRETNAALAELTALRDRTLLQFNPAVLRLPAPVSNLYIPGRELMEPAALRIALHSASLG